MPIQFIDTRPAKGRKLWQFDLLPAIALLVSRDPEDPYWALSVQWLFWTIRITNAKSPVDYD